MSDVLVVDDEPSVRLLLRDILEMEGYDVLEAPDGPTALTMLTGHRPACVLLDVMMPGMSGIEVLAKVRLDDGLMDLPVMMLTAASDDQTTWSGWSAGADYYLPKPFDVDHLLMWVGKLVAGPDLPSLFDEVDLDLTDFSSSPAQALQPAQGAHTIEVLAAPGAELFRLAFDDVLPYPTPTLPGAPSTLPATAGVWRKEFDAPLDVDLERALRTDQIWVAYQPIVALDGDDVVGVEALARWRHPQRGDLAPSEFIPLAEKCGLADELGWKILLPAARQVVAWNTLRAASGLPLLFLSVNVSSRQLAGTQFLAQALERLATTGLAPELLVLEVGEPGLVALTGQALLAVQGITGAGVRLCLDDFAAVDVSISYLRTYPVDFVKIDRTFVRGIGENAADDAAASKIIGLARKLDRIAIAEGVETRQQAERLRDLGCTYAQGFYFAHPVAGAHLDELMLATVASHASGGPDHNSAHALDRSARRMSMHPQECDNTVDSARLDRLDRALSATAGRPGNRTGNRLI